MSDYSVAFSGFASTSTKVTAETPQAAIDMAEPYVSLCHQCAREAEIGDEWEPVEVIDLDTGDVVWTAPDTQEQATDYLDKLAKARNVIEQVRDEVESLPDHLRSPAVRRISDILADAEGSEQ